MEEHVTNKDGKYLYSNGRYTHEAETKEEIRSYIVKLITEGQYKLPEFV